MTYTVQSALATVLVATGASFFMGPLYAIVVAATISLGIITFHTVVGEKRFGSGRRGMSIPLQALEWVRMTLLGIIGTVLTGIVVIYIGEDAFVPILFGAIIISGYSLYKWDPTATAANE